VEIDHASTTSSGTTSWVSLDGVSFPTLF
jgi:hypothetical protein